MIESSTGGLSASAALLYRFAICANECKPFSSQIVPCDVHALSSQEDNPSLSDIQPLPPSSGVAEVYNRLLSDGTHAYAYDAEGNRTRRTVSATGEATEYGWDHRNRLKSLTFKDSAGTVTGRLTYRYDPADRRIMRLHDADGDGTFETRTVFIFDQGVKNGLDDCVLVFDNNTLTQRLLHGPGVDQPLAQEGASGNVVWPLSDPLGTLRDLAQRNASGGTVITNHLTYDSFGRLLSQSDPSQPSRYGFTGREWDADAGLWWYRARWYDAGVGRFVSEDFAQFGNAEYNFMRYALNNPVGLNDPSGEDWLDTAANYCAGIGDSLTFGATDYIRSGLGINDGIQHGSTAYIAGQATEIAAELAVTGGGAALRHAAAKAATKAAARSTAKASGRSVFGNSARAAARRLPPARPAGTTRHHVNSLFWPPFRPRRKGTNTITFPLRRAAKVCLQPSVELEGRGSGGAREASPKSLRSRANHKIWRSSGGYGRQSDK